MHGHSTDLFGDEIQPGKNCTKCGKFFPFEEFGFRWSKLNRHARHTWCKACKRAQTHLWVKRVGKKRARRTGIKAKYGITPAQYDQMVIDQKGACAICGCTEMPIDPRTNERYDLAIDHDHDTGKVRALLCPFCNNGLGCFKDNVQLLHAAISYLDRFSTPLP